MLDIKTRVKEIQGIDPTNIPPDILASDQPLILKGLARQWPLAKVGLESNEAAINYLRSFYEDKTVGTFFGTPENDGFYFYTPDMSALNYRSERVRLDSVLDQILAHMHNPHPPTFYVGSTTVDVCLPGLREQGNDVPIPFADALVSIWIGNKSRIACHYDAPDNLACSVVGQRRFTVFPPEQIENLYPGPLDFNPAGQQISLVDFSKPDFEKFPRFREAMVAGQVANMEPGDALFIPSMWWHHVEGMGTFNVLVNYWWRNVPKFMGPAINVLKHAMLSIRDLPEKERAAWKSLFDFYIFGDTSVPRENLPPSAQGVLAPMDDLQSRQLRAWLINRLNR
ncbi:MAG TPA: cupin-like domain-containing protein [Cellvibrio sp.]|nr:cupin-like domain-containing protein [Cellvibrio sp.]